MASGISSIPRQELGRGRNRGHVRSSLSSQAPAWRHRQRGQVEEKRKEEQKEKKGPGARSAASDTGILEPVEQLRVQYVRTYGSTQRGENVLEKGPHCTKQTLWYLPP